MERKPMKLLIPALRPFYEWAEPVSWLLVRPTALGLLTRFFAVGIAVEMAVIAAVYFPKFGWTGPGYEYPLMWCLIMIAIALRGGGPYSIDRRLGREL